MQTYTISGSAWEGDLPLACQAHGSPVTPEFIDGTLAAPPLTAFDEDQVTHEGQNNLPPLASQRLVECFPGEGYLFGWEVAQ